MTVVKDATESVEKLSGKKKKTKPKVRDHGQEDGKVSDKSTKSAARNITREHVWIIICAIKERWVWTKYFDSCSTSEAISVFLFAFVPFQRRHVAPFSLEAWSRREFIEKVIEGWYMGHFLIIGQTIGIDLTLAQIISDFKELSSTLSFSKF